MASRRLKSRLLYASTPLLAEIEAAGQTEGEGVKGRSAYLRGLVHLERGDAQSAIAMFEEALKEGEGPEVSMALMQAQDDLSEGRHIYCVRTFEGHSKRVDSVCLSANGKWALTGGVDKSARLWEIDTGYCVQIFEEHIDSVYAVCLSADGNWVLTGSHETVCLWEVDTGQCVQTLEGYTSP